MKTSEGVCIYPGSRLQTCRSSVRAKMAAAGLSGRRGGEKLPGSALALGLLVLLFGQGGIPLQIVVHLPGVGKIYFNSANIVPWYVVTDTHRKPVHLYHCCHVSLQGDQLRDATKDFVGGQCP